MSDLRMIEELVRRCQQNLPDDTRAFEQIVALFSGQVFATACRLLRDRQEAEDQTQEVFIKVYRGIKQINDPTTFPYWLKRIVTNTCLDTLDRWQRSPLLRPLPSIEADYEGAECYADLRTPTPEDAAMRREFYATIEQVLANMEPGARTVLLLRELEQRSYQEIADYFNIGLSATKMRIRRARQAFQAISNRLDADSGYYN